jgi:hypothetical protein
MIKELANNIAAEMGIKLSGISLVDGVRLGCLGVYLLHMSKDGQNVSALIYQSDVDSLKSGDCDERLVIRLQSTLSRLQDA